MGKSPGIHQLHPFSLDYHQDALYVVGSRMHTYFLLPIVFNIIKWYDAFH